MDLAIAAAVGLTAGIMSGMFGVGGGIVIVPALVLLLQFPIHRAVGTSLASLLLPVAIFGVLNYSRHGDVDVKAAGAIALGLAISVPLGSMIALGLDNKVLTKIFGAFLLAVAIRFLFFSN